MPRVILTVSRCEKTNQANYLAASYLLEAYRRSVHPKSAPELETLKKAEFAAQGLIWDEIRNFHFVEAFESFYRSLKELFFDDL